MVRFVSQVDPLLLEDGTYFVLEAGGDLVGCGGWSRRDKLYTGGDDAGGERLLDPATEPARVRAMFVRADWTRRGLGRRILDDVRGGGEERGLPNARPVGDDVGAAPLPHVRVRANRGAGDDHARRSDGHLRLDAEAGRMRPDDRLAEAIVLRESGDLEQALPLLLALREEFPDDARIAVQTAWTHDSLGLEEEAAEHYEAAIRGDLSDDELRGLYLGLGSTYRTLGRDADSERVFREGIERFPDFKPLRVFNAMLDYNLGRPREAVRALIEVLLEASDDPTIQRYRRSLTGYAEDLDRSWLDER